MGPKCVEPNTQRDAIGKGNGTGLDLVVAGTRADCDAARGCNQDARIATDPTDIVEGFWPKLVDQNIDLRLFRESSVDGRGNDAFKQPM